MTAHSLYPEIARRGRSGEKILDLGCCFGADVRKLVYDGVPARNIHGFELEQDFLDMGFDFFRDRGRLGSKFTADNFLDPKTADLDGQEFDIIHASMIFHLFELEDQTKGYTNAVKVLKKRPGSVIFGRNTTLIEAQALDSTASPTGRIWVHNAESFEAMIKEIGTKTHTKLKVVSERREIPEYGLDDTRWGFQYFSITIE